MEVSRPTISSVQGHCDEVAQGCVQLRFLIFPRMKTPQTLWVTCSSVWPPSLGKMFSLSLVGVSCTSVCVHCFCHWILRRVFTHLILCLCIWITVPTGLLQAEQSPLLPCVSDAPVHSSSPWPFSALAPVSTLSYWWARTGPSTPNVSQYVWAQGEGSALDLLVTILQMQPRRLVALFPMRADCWGLMSIRTTMSFPAKVSSSCVDPCIYWCMGLFLPKRGTFHFPLLNSMRFLLAFFSNLLRSLWIVTPLLLGAVSTEPAATLKPYVPVLELCNCIYGYIHFRNQDKENSPISSKSLCWR